MFIAESIHASFELKILVNVWLNNTYNHVDFNIKLYWTPFNRKPNGKEMASFTRCFAARLSGVFCQGMLKDFVKFCRSPIQTIQNIIPTTIQLILWFCCRRPHVDKLYPI